MMQNTVSFISTAFYRTTAILKIQRNIGMMPDHNQQNAVGIHQQLLSGRFGSNPDQGYGTKGWNRFENRALKWARLIS